MKRWVVILTAGSGYSQKYAPPLTFFKKKADAIKHLRNRIKDYIDHWRESCERYGGKMPFQSIKQFLEHNCITQFETNEGEFFLEEAVFE
tara:strand:+ start:931 stop:1200 length:270 start_codon:yes stop_codon:yes gene_type:complete